MGAMTLDCLNNPLGVVRSVFEKAVADGEDPKNFGNTDWGMTDLFQRFLYEQNGLSKVPLLHTVNAHLVQPNSLVRFRGMIQDMFDNEFYIGAFKDGMSWRTNKLMDAASSSMESASEVQIWDRRLLYCVPIPGENTWASESSTRESSMQFFSDTSMQREKRQRELVSTGESSCDMSCSEMSDLALGAKKLCENGAGSQLLQIKDASMIDDPCGKKDVSFGAHFLSCLVKMYDARDADVKLNDVFEFIGVFTFNPELVTPKSCDDGLVDDPYQNVSAQLPPSKVPRLHCIISKKLTTKDFLSASVDNPSYIIQDIRASLLRYFTSILGGDGLTANFLLLHLLSQVQARVDSVAVGKLSLNLTGFTKESESIFGTRLKHAIQNLLPFSHIISLTVEYLNAASLAPKKDYNINRLLSGALQLAHGTHLTIDETQMLPGSLNAVGIENANLLRDLLELQKVAYDFEYYKVEMEADIKVLVISSAKSNIAPCDLVVPFHPMEVVFDSNGHPPELQAWRWYLNTIGSMSHTIDALMQETLEDDMVAARQVDRALGPDDFSRWLTTARLLSISYGEEDLTLEHWQQVKEMERLRKERICKS